MILQRCLKSRPCGGGTARTSHVTPWTRSMTNAKSKSLSTVRLHETIRCRGDAVAGTCATHSGHLVQQIQGPGFRAMTVRHGPCCDALIRDPRADQQDAAPRVPLLNQCRDAIIRDRSVGQQDVGPRRLPQVAHAPEAFPPACPANEGCSKQHAPEASSFADLPRPQRVRCLPDPT